MLVKAKSKKKKLMELTLLMARTMSLVSTICVTIWHSAPKTVLRGR